MEDTITITLTGFNEIELEVSYFEGSDYYEAMSVYHNEVDIIQLLKPDVLQLINEKLTEKLG